MIAALVFAVATALAGTPVPASPPAAPITDPSPTWEATLKKVVPAVVSIRVTQTRDFDTEDAGTSYGTGFIIDAARGIILTNRHMVHAGPVLAQAVFEKGEEVDLVPIYRDPIHDFGFYRFNPKDVEHMAVTDLPLAPEAARAGVEIRVVGNDAGEKLSILDGTLARLDRPAPNYGGDTYNDFNTFYYQAASNTSGGSSGSPVVDIQGRVVALNAGGSTQAASSFYLPLDRVVAAYKHVIAGEPVPRGTLSAVFEYTDYKDAVRLGLPPEVESATRAKFPDATGMLVVDETVPGQAAWDDLQSGDILEKVDGQQVNDFIALETILDAKVGQKVSVGLWRGGEALNVSLNVDDLHSLTPARYLEVGRAVVHDVSFQQARNHGVPIGGVYVAVPGYWLGFAGVPEEAVITAVDGIDVDGIDDFRTELEGKADGKRVTLRYHNISEPRRDLVAVATLDRTWFPMRTCARDDTTGHWPCVDSPPPPEAAPQAPETATFATTGPKLAAKIAPSMVVVDFDVPYPTAGLKDFNYSGAGLVIDAEKGLVVVDRDTVPVVLGDITLTFGGSVRIAAHVVYLHPMHDLAILQYDPKLLGDTQVRAVEFSTKDMEPGDSVWQLGIDSRFGMVARQTRIESYEALRFGIAGTPRFRDSNVEGVDLRDSTGSLGGAVCDNHGRVLAVWASFVDQGSGDRHFYGLPSMYVTRVTDALIAGKDPDYRAIGAEFSPTSVVEARDRGLSEARFEELSKVDPDRHEVLEVRRVAAGMPAEKELREGDLLLEVDGAPITRVRDLEALSAHARVHLLVLRDKKELELDVDTFPVDGNGTDRVVAWAGLTVHAPHLEVATQQGIAPTGVYAAWLWYGSPGATYGLRPTRRITAINGIPTPDLDAFEKVVSAIGDHAVVRVQSLSLDGKVQTQTLVTDTEYWPTIEVDRVNGEWVRRAITAPAVHPD